VPNYRPEFAETARKVCELGATNRELADFFKVSTVTIWNWQAEHPEFLEALRRGKAVADDRVERSLYAMASGYTYESEKIVIVDGHVHRVPTVVHVPPSDTACIFWLKHRRPSWR